MPVTMKDVAREAGVSLGTVSNYMNGKAGLKQDNRERIEAAISKLGYEVNVVARNLKMKRSMLVGVLIPSFGNVFAVRIISYLERYFREKGYGLHVVSYDRDPAQLENQMTGLMGMKVDALILMPSVTLSPAAVARINSLTEKQIPVVVFDSTGDGLKCDHVVLNNFNSYKESVKYLLEKGHEKIALIAGPENVYSTEERVNGYKTVLKEAGRAVEEDLIVYTDYSKRNGKEKTIELLAKRQDITVVLTAGYRLTLGAFAAFNEKQTAVPEAMSLMGFDIYDIANILPYNLTGITIPVKTVAMEIVTTVLDRVNHGFEAAPMIKGVQMMFIEGDSVRQV